MKPDLILEKTMQLNLPSDIVTKRSARGMTHSRGLLFHRRKVILAFALGALPAALGHAEPLDPAAFRSLGPSPFVRGTFAVDTSFDNPAPTIQQGTTVIATGIFYDPTPADTANRDEIAVFTFDTIDLPTGVTLEGLRNANSRPVALLSKDTMTVGGLIDFSGEQGYSGPDWSFDGGVGGAAGPGGGGGGGGAGTGEIDAGLGYGAGGGAGLVPGQPGQNWPFGAPFTAGGAGGSVEADGGGTDLGNGGGAGGGAFGGNGGDGFATLSPGGTAYGDLTAKLEGGSGGAGSGAREADFTGGPNFGGSGGGGGGGAIELGAATSLMLSGQLTARGGAGGPRSEVGPAGGAGGGVILHANFIVLDSAATVNASGGAGDQKGGGGGGGRVLLLADTITTTGLAAAINIAGGTGGDLGGSPGGNGVFSVSGTVHTISQILCPESTSISCAPASGMPVTLSLAVSDPDPDEILTITLKEGSTVLDTKSASTPINNFLVTFDPVVLSAMPHALTLEVTDGIVTASCTTSVTVEADTGAPSITACSPNQSVNATSLSGAVVNYPAATASDNCAPPILNYSQAAGTLCQIGDTTVTVTATDVGGNQATCTFIGHVKGATEQLSDLKAYLAGLAIDNGTKVSLQAKLTAAQSALAASHPQDSLTALQDFINATSAVKGKKLSAAEASRLISDATRIRAMISG